MYVAWHLKGAGSWHDWMKISNFDRAVILSEVGRRIELHNSQYDKD